MTTETHRCPICNDLFFPRRSDARYCSARCRKRANRSGIRSGRIATDNRQIHYQIAEKQIRELAAIGANGSLRALVLMALNHMDQDAQAKIREALK